MRNTPNLIFAVMLYVVVLWISPAQSAEKRRYLIGNSLTWDTIPSRLDGKVEWHVDCGKSLPYIKENPKAPCVKSSTLWPTALKQNQYDLISVQPHYGSTIKNDVETISEWVKMQPQATFVIHTGWAKHALRKEEYESFTNPHKMMHNITYIRKLQSELLKRNKGLKLKQTYAQFLLQTVQEDIDLKNCPVEKLTDLYRDAIHMTTTHGRYLMHNAMRHALEQPFSAEGFKELDPRVKTYLDELLSLLNVDEDDLRICQEILSTDFSGERLELAEKISHPELRRRLIRDMASIVKTIELKTSLQHLSKEILAAGGKIVNAPCAPAWMVVATKDGELKPFLLPVSLDFYKARNLLRSMGKTNSQVTDDYLASLKEITTLRHINLANCTIDGKGLCHLKGMQQLKEINLTFTGVNDSCFKALSQLPALKVIGLSCTRCTGTGFKHFAPRTEFETINLHDTPLNDEGLTEICNHQITDTFWIAHTKFTDEGAIHVARLTSLKRCGIGSNHPQSTGESVSYLADLPLQELVLVENQACHTGILHASKIKTLRVFEIYHALDINEETMKLLASMPALLELRLAKCPLTKEGLTELAKSRSLKKLILSGHKKMGDEHKELLQKLNPQIEVTIK